MKKKAKRHPNSRLHVVCPFCDHAVNHLPSTVTPWCGNCGVEFYANRAGDVMFDDKRKTPRLALAKAIQLSGKGISMGKLVKED